MWAELIARSWLTWQLTGSTTAIGLVHVARAVPLITIGLFGGVIADRFDKRKILIVIQFWTVCIYIALAILVVGGWVQLWHVYLTSFLLGLGMAMNQPVRTSLIPQLLEGKLLLNALSLNSIAINVARLAGPGAIGFMIAAANDNVGPAYIVASAVYIIVISSTFMIRVPPTTYVAKRVSIGQDFIDGFRYMLFENRTVLALVVIAMGPLAFAFSYINLLPAFVTDVLEMDAAAFGTMQSIAAIGALTGGIVLATKGTVGSKGKFALTAGLTYGVIVALFAVLKMPILVFAVMPIIGASQAIFRALNNSSLLEITPGHLRGRVMSMTFLDMGMQSVAAIVSGVVSDQWGVSYGFLVLGGMCIAIVGIIGISVPAVRRL